MKLQQTDIFGEIDKAKIRPEHLPLPLHDWALSLYITLQHPKGVTVFDAMLKYGMPKYQERLNEILQHCPHLVKKEMVSVRKRLNRQVDVMKYSIANEDAAIDFYMQINKKGGFSEYKKRAND